MPTPPGPSLAELSRMRAWWTAAGLTGELVLAALLGLLAHTIVSRLAARAIRRTPWKQWEDLLLKWLRPPSRVAFPILFVVLDRARQRLVGMVTGPPTGLDRALQLAVTGVLTWIAVASIGALAEFVKRRHRIDTPDNREARRVHTQVTVIGRSLEVLAMVVGFAAALMTFPRVRELGTSLLASAGIAGIIVGLAARPVLENLIAGVQIGLAQPIRIDDVVIMDGEWGRIEEITLTYVVVRIWDQRTLIVPFSRFLSDTFQNWTRTTAHVWGTVFLWVDYAAPIESIRQAADRIVKSSPHWDGRIFALQVTDATERSVQLRVLASATDAGRAINLRSEIRERLLDYLAREHPASLPRVRLDTPTTDQTRQVGP